MQYLADVAGLRIRLTDERLDHIREHPEMAGAEAWIGETLAAPERVVQSISDPEANLYYRYYHATAVGSKWLCVVVKVTRRDAFIITAYLTDRINRGVVIWPPSL